MFVHSHTSAPYAEEPLELRYYREMVFIRRFEEMLLRLFDTGVLNGTTHACIGQEADCVAVLDQLTEGDHVFSNHRCHGHYLAWTGDAFGLLAEIMGKSAGTCGGIGGSQHLCAPGFKSNGIQGGIVPAAAGIALAHRLDGSSAVSCVFIGDGTLGEGAVYEALNIASLWSLPLLIVLEDNGWAQSTPSSANLAGSMRGRFESFGIEVLEVDSTDVMTIRDLAREAVASVREQGRPMALIIHTYRLCHHSKNDDNRPASEVEARWLHDPVAIHGDRLSAQDRQRIEQEVDLHLAEVLEKAKRLP